MRFYIEIDEEELLDEYGGNFEELVMSRAVKEVATRLVNKHVTIGHLESTLKSEVSKLLKDRTDEIVKSVIDTLVRDISKKRDIKSFTPTSSELTAAKSDWHEYFSKLINEAIAKKFN